MSERGFDYVGEENDNDGLPIFTFRQKGTGFEIKSNDYKFPFFRDNETLKNIYEPLAEPLQKIEKLPQIYEKLQLQTGQAAEKLENLYVSLIDKAKIKESVSENNSSTTQVNNVVNGTSQIVDTSPMSSRNQDSSLNSCLNKSTVPC
jgi:transcriptional regulator of aromatic amino acid metabolism